IGIPVSFPTRRSSDLTTPVSNPVYQQAHRATNIERGIHQFGKDNSMMYRLGSLGRAGGGLAGATLTPLAYAQAAMSPVLQERQRSEEHTSELQSRENL